MSAVLSDHGKGVDICGSGCRSRHHFAPWMWGGECSFISMYTLQKAVAGTQKLRWICWVEFANHLTFLSSVFRTSSRSFSMLGAFMANKAQPSVSVHWRLLGGLTKRFEEFNVNESGTHGFNFSGNSHVLGNEGGQCLAKCALIYLTPKYTPPLSLPPLRVIQNFA